MKISYISYFTILLLVFSSFSVAFGISQNYNSEMLDSNLASENSDYEGLAGTTEYEPVNLKDKIVVIKNSQILNNQESVPSTTDSIEFGDSIKYSKNVYIPKQDFSSFAIPERISERSKISIISNEKLVNSLANLNLEFLPSDSDSNPVFDPEAIGIIPNPSYAYSNTPPVFTSTSTEDWSESLPILILVPVASLAVRNYENKKNQSSLFWRFIPSFIIIILISSIIITPFSVSFSYWGFAYAEKPTEFDESVSVVPSNDTSTEIQEFSGIVDIVPSNSTLTEIQEFSGIVDIVPSNSTLTEIQEFSGIVDIVPSNDTSTEIPEATISLDFDYDLTNKFTDEQYDDSLELDGEEGFLQISENSTDNVSFLTITAWVKPDYSQGSPEFTVISKEKSFSLSINNNIHPEKIAKFSVFDGIKWTTVESKSIIDEEWTFLVATFDGDSIRIGVNNEMWETKQVSNIPAIHNGKLVTTTVDNLSSEEDIVIGAYINTLRDGSKPHNKFSGEIDDVLLYDSLLDESIIQQIYNENADSYSYQYEEMSFEEILESLDTIESTTIKTSDVNATGFVNVNATEILEFDESVSVVPTNYTSTEIQTFGNSTSIVPTNQTSIEIPTFSECTSIVPSNQTSTEPVDINATYTDIPTFSECVSVIPSNQTSTEIITSENGFAHDVIEINKPVTWIQNVILSNQTEIVAIELPADAKILEVIIVDKSNTKSMLYETEVQTPIAQPSDLEESTDVGPDSSDGIFDEQDIEEKKIEKLKIIDAKKVPIVSVKTNRTDDISVSATYVELDDLKEIKSVVKKATNSTIASSELVPVVSLEEEVPEMIQQEKPTKLLVVNYTSKEINLKFETPAPYTKEVDQTTTETYSKKVTVAHDSAFHYTDVKSYSSIPEPLVKEGIDFKLYWNINGTKTDVTDDPRFQVKFVDTNDNGVADQMQWIVPQLSEQEFEIEAKIVIINVQSYPVVGGNWTVYFTTQGTADLIITGINGTTFGEAEPDDLKFLELNDGTQTLTPIIQGNSIIYHNYSSTEQGFEASKVLTSGKHHLMFQFGNDIGLANNDAEANRMTRIIKLSGTTGTGATQSVTISPALNSVDKAISFCTFRHTQPQNHDGTFKAWEITATNTLTIYQGASAVSINYLCYVVEFTSTSTLDSHSSSFQQPATGGSATVTTNIGQTVVLAETMEWYQGHDHDGTDTTIGQEELERVRLSSTTQWEWNTETAANSGPQNNYIGLVDWNDSDVSVQRGQATMLTTETTDTLVGGTDFTAVDRDRTLLFVSFRKDGANFSYPVDNTYIHATLDASGNIVVTRGTNTGTSVGQVLYNWVLAELPVDFVTVQHLTHSFTGTSATDTITTLNDQNRAFVAGTVCTPFGCGTGSITGTTAIGAIDQIQSTLDITADDTVTITRGDGTGTHTVGYQVVEFLPIKRVLTDTPAISDSETLVKHHVISATDTPTITDSETLVEHHVISATDAPVITDNETFGFTILDTDTPTITDNETLVKHHVISATDTPAITDSDSTIKGFVISATDTPAITDNETVVENHVISATDAPAITDNETLVKASVICDCWCICS